MMSDQINYDDEPILAWHFVGKTLRDGRPVPADGEVLSHDGPIKICSSGLHWSRDSFDALYNAPGPILCRVEAWGNVAEQIDKGVSRHRRSIARRDVTDMLRAFARERALSVAHLWDPPAVVMEYLQTGNKALRSSAWSAARNATWALQSLEGAAARDAAFSAARNESWSAARGAARDEVWVATWYATRNEVWGATWDAARNQAWDAARATARSNIRSRFNEMVKEEFAKEEGL